MSFGSQGFIPHIMLSYISCIGSYWEEMNLLRNYQPDYGSEFESTKVFSLYACMSHCSMTDGCNYVSFIAKTYVCLRHHKFVGFKYKFSSSVWSLLKEDGCPKGWYSFKSSCFLLPDLRLQWEDSINYCQRLTAKQAELDTGPKNVFIKSVAERRPESVKRVWIGGSDIVEDGTWVWKTSGSPMSNYTNWCPKQPNNVAGKSVDADCACFLPGYDYVCWHDCACSMNGHPICEKQKETD